MQQCFSNEVQANGGAHTQSYVTAKADGSDKYNEDLLQHKYSKLLVWMFHGIIAGGKKGPATFWEKDQGTVTAKKYNEHILPIVEELFKGHLDFNEDKMISKGWQQQ